MALQGALDVGLRRAGFQAQFRIQGIQLEEIAVRLTRWRTRAAITDLAEIIAALARAAGKLFLLRHSFGKFPRVWRKIIKHPVYPDARGGVGIVHDERKGLRICRWIIPFQLRGDVRAITSKLF